MSILGIITCEILENEFAYLLASDPDIGQITILENTHSNSLIEILESSYSRDVNRIPHIRAFQNEPSEKIEVIIRVLELGLHNKVKLLQKNLVHFSKELAGHVDALLLGYGLCGNALENPKYLLDVDIPIFIPMDNDHPVDDCVGLLIGGRDCYYAQQCKEPGTFFMIPGWTYHWKRMFDDFLKGADKEMIRRIFENYQRSLLVLTPIMSEDQMKENVAEFNKILGLRTETCGGNLDILKNTWKSAKYYVAGLIPGASQK